MGTLLEYQHIFMIISRSVLLTTRNVSDKSSRESQNTHFMFKHFFFNLAIYEIMWRNIVELDRPCMAIWRMYIACGLTKARDTHSEYVIFIAFPLQQWLDQDASILHLTSEFSHDSLSLIGRKVK